MQDTSLLQVNLAAVNHNMQVLRDLVGPDCSLCPIVKADAYGLGGLRLGTNLAAAGADMLAVYTAQQATELMRGSIDVPVLVLMPVYEIGRTDEIYRGLIRGKVHLAVHDHQHLDGLIRLCERFGCQLPLHLEVDTGMSRSGCRIEDAPGLLRRVAEAKRVTLAGVFSHFVSAGWDESRTDDQLRIFENVIEENRELIPEDCLVHLANTPATLRHPRYHQRMVRVGLAWAGYGVELIEGGEVISDAQHLRPAVTWTSRIVQLKNIQPGETVGYDATWTAERPTRLGLVPVGYADGYPADLGRRDGDTDECAASVSVIVEGPDGGLRPISCPIVGSVNMDQITIDLTDLPQDHVQIGTPVELISPDPTAPNHLPRLARLAGTFSHELLCRLNSRIRRMYYSSDAQEPAASHPAAMAG